MIQPELPGGYIPRDPSLRQSLIWIAHRAEGDGADGIGINLATPSGRAAWRDLQRAIRWIYDHAIDPLPEADLEASTHDDAEHATAAAADR